MRILSALVLSVFIALSLQLVGQAQTSQEIAAEFAAAHRSGEAYSTTVEGSRGKGLLQLEAAAYVLISRVDTSELGGKGAFQPWHDELRRLSISSEGLTGVIAILGTPGLVSSGKITRESFDRYFTRLKSLTPEMFKRWRATNKSTVDDLVLVHLVIAHEPLFAGAEPQEARRQRELKRFESIPADAISAWSTAAARPFQPAYEGQSVPVGWSGVFPPPDAAFELLRVDSLFVGDVFDLDRFKGALPIATTLLSSRKPTRQPSDAQPDATAPKSENIKEKSLIPRTSEKVSGPLGSKINPVRCDNPSGEQQYLNRLRCANGARPQYERMGSFGFGPYRNILDMYKVKCEGEALTIFMDMHHKGYVEKEAVPGFTIDQASSSSTESSIEKEKGSATPLPTEQAIIGFWKLNLEKSKLSPVPNPASGLPSRRFINQNGQIVAQYLGDNSQGISNSSGTLTFPIVWIGKFDGVARPVLTQNLDSLFITQKFILTEQTRAYTSVNSHTEIVVKGPGKFRRNVTLELSSDGQTLTETVRAVDKKGQVIATNYLVFERSRDEAYERVKREKESQYYSERGRAHSRNGELDLAIQDFTKALSIDPDDRSSYLGRGQAHLKKANFELSIQDLTKFISFNPSYAYGYLDRGRAYYELGRFELAIQDFTKFISDHPRAGPVYQLRAKAYRGLGKSNLAEADEKKAEELVQKKP